MGGQGGRDIFLLWMFSFWAVETSNVYIVLNVEVDKKYFVKKNLRF